MGIVLAALLVAGCQPASSQAAPSQPAPTIPSTLPTPSGLAPTVSVSASQRPWPAGKTVALPPSYRFHSMSSEGPLAVLDEIASADDGLQSDVVLVDLAHGTWKILARAVAGYHPWNPVISGDNVAWEEWKYSGGSIVGDCDWRIVALSLNSGRSRVLASGRDTRRWAGNASCPAFDLDGGQLAYSVENTSPGRPFGWLVKIVDISTGHLVRTVATAEQINYFAFWNGSVAYTEGTVDQAGGVVYDTRLMLSTPGVPQPVQIDSGAYVVSFRGGRLAWTADAGASQGGSGVALGQRAWTAIGPSWTPTPVTADAPPSGVDQVWPSASSNSVCFTKMAYSGAGTMDVWIWDRQSGSSDLVPGSEGGLLCGQGGGWVDWAGGIGESVTVSGLVAP